MSPRPLEELYDTLLDPQELVNLAGQPEHARTLRRMRGALDDWLARVGDKGAVDESDMIESMWPGGQQPVTDEPKIVLENQRLVMTSSNARCIHRLPGKGVGGRRPVCAEGRWQLYTEPVLWQPENPSTQIEAKAVRYGYAESAVISFSAN